MKYQKPKGTADIFEKETVKWQYVEQTARNLFKKYRYFEIRTPMFENFEVFSRTSGETSDIVTKEMYDFYDKGNRHITLRPEGTAGVVRAYIENKMYGPEVTKPVKTYYMGPMFRYERPQSGRLREFHQIGVEAFGVKSAALDVEVIAMAIDLLQTLGIKDLKISLNSLGDLETRKEYKKALIDYLVPLKDKLSIDSKKRLEKNPLRILDSKDQKDQELLKQAPLILDYLTKDAKKHFDKVKKLLDELNIAYEIDQNMVRGLDYYNHTIFEIMSNSEVFNHKWTTICAGGRYDGLVKQLGGPDISGVGFALGVERLLLILENQNLNLSDTLDVYIVSIGENAEDESIKISQSLRKQGFTVDKDYLNRKPKSQFKTASKLGAKYTLTIGENELENGIVNLKDMASATEKKVLLKDVYEEFSKLIIN